jgi:ammonium transporter, Amt family
VAHWRASSNLDDTLDVFPCHGVGGMVGMLMTGIFATSAVNAAVVENGLFYGEICFIHEAYFSHWPLFQHLPLAYPILLLIITDKIIPSSC